MPIAINVSADVAKIRRSLDDFRRKQLPFATAKALTAIARNVQGAETKALSTAFEKPTPFTQRAFGVIAARKSKPEAVVFAKDIQARYLEPYEFGGKQVLGTKKGMLTPKPAQPLNAYGNLSKGALQRLKGRPDVFIGAVKTKTGGTINGVWQRPTDVRRVTLLNAKGKRLRGLNQVDRQGKGSLKLLIRFTDPLPVKPKLGFRERAQRIVDETFAREMARALDEAMRTAR